MKLSFSCVSSRLAAAFLAGILSCTCLTACSSEQDSRTESTSSVSESAVDSKADSQPETQTSTEPPTTEHISPRENVVSTLGTQVDVDVTLNRDTDNTYQTKLAQFVPDGAVVDSFTFIFYAADGVSNIGTYKGGCGISVTGDCPSATDEGWYQSEDFSVSANGAYVAVNWQVPGEIRDYVETNGEVLVGYWWGNTTSVTLSSVICNYTYTMDLPVDGTETLSINQNLNFNSESSKTLKVSLADVLKDHRTPQAITFQIHADRGLGKFTGAFGITTNAWYQSDTIATLTDASSLTLTWILPEDVKASVPADAEVMLGYWWGEPSEITLESVAVKYSIGTGGGSVSETPKETINSVEITGKEQQTAMTNATAAQIVSDIKVGWNLGNTLDCYGVDWELEGSYETAWGNPETTKSMIDAVKAAGFNAVRIPVSWADHMDADGNVDAAWMDRVQEVVDYSMDNGLYTILNVHHDDYVWIKPLYSEEAAVKAKYVKLWTQIAARFKDYDNSLLFEGLNEPRVVGSAAEWMGGTPEEHDVINHLLQAFVDTVRASGGNNASRTLIVTTHAASITTTAVDGLVLPQDDNLIVSIHNYAPWKFTTLEFPDDKTFDDRDKAELDKHFDYLYDKFVSQGVPVIIGEFGAENKNNTADREAYYSYYVAAAAERGIPCFIWDNGPTDSYGILNREEGSWYFGGIVNGMMDAAE